MKTESTIFGGTRKVFTSALFVLASLPMFQANAAIVTFDDRAAWEAAAGTWVATDTFPGIANYSIVNSITLNNGTILSLDDDVEKRTIGNGWETWSGGFTGDVFFGVGLTSVEASVTPVAGLGFEMQPNPFASYLMSLTLSDGSVVSQLVNGIGGAAFFGWVGEGVTSFTMSSSEDFAFGRFVEAEGGQVPEPATVALIGLGMLGATLGRRRTRKHDA